MATLRKQLAVTAGAMALTLAVPLLATAEQQGVIAGTVVDFHGKYGLVIRDARGALANVTLHQGTIIKPVGLRLERGMTVIVLGRSADQAFAAGEIDAPLEQWPTARALAHARPGSSDRADSRPLATTRDNPNTRWQESPDFNVPIVREPVNPH